MPQSHKFHPHTFSWKIDINSHFYVAEIWKETNLYVVANFQNRILSKIQLFKSIRTRLIEMILWHGDGGQSKLTLVSIQWVVKNPTNAADAQQWHQGFVPVVGGDFYPKGKQLPSTSVSVCDRIFRSAFFKSVLLSCEWTKRSNVSCKASGRSWMMHRDAKKFFLVSRSSRSFSLSLIFMSTTGRRGSSRSFSLSWFSHQRQGEGSWWTGWSLNGVPTNPSTKSFGANV